MSTSMRVNLHDYLLLPVYVICIAVALGLITSDPMGFDLGQAVWESGDHYLSIANLGALATLAYVAYSNDWSNAHLSSVQIWIIIATVGLIIAPPFFPVLEGTLTETPAALVAAGIQIGGYVTFSYVG